MAISTVTIYGDPICKRCPLKPARYLWEKTRANCAEKLAHHDLKDLRKVPCLACPMECRNPSL